MGILLLETTGTPSIVVCMCILLVKTAHYDELRYEYIFYFSAHFCMHM